jgi:hypothetical protein
VLWIQAPRLFDEFKVDEDFRSFYWMNKFRDPSLFPNDALGNNLYVDIQVPNGGIPLYFYSLGYGLLFLVASFFMDPVLFSKVLAFLLLPVSVLYLYEFGRSVRSRNTGIMLAVGFLLLNLASSTSLSVTSGLQRAFAFPLMIVFIYYLHRQQYIACAVTIVMSALIYPPIFLLAVGSWGLSMLRIGRHPRVNLFPVKRGFGILLISFLTGALILFPVQLPRFTDALGNGKSAEAAEDTPGTASHSYSHLWDDPHYGPQGRKPLFDFFPFVGRAGLVEKFTEAAHILILLIVGCLIVVLRGRRALELPFEIWCVLLASLALFAMAWMGIWLTNSFLLYMPSRYTHMGLLLFTFMFVFLNVEASVNQAALTLQHGRKIRIWLIVGGELLVLAFVLLIPAERAILNGLNIKWLLGLAGVLLGILGIFAIRRPSSSVANLSRLRLKRAGRILVGLSIVLPLIAWAAYASKISSGPCLDPSPSEREMLRFVETLPKDALLAGTPCALDNVPLFAKREILFSCEQMSADAELMHEALGAYYAPDGQTVAGFCDARGVDYLVIDRKTYSEEYIAAGKVFFDPFNQELTLRTAGQNTYAVLQVSEDRKLFQSGDLFVIACSADVFR